MASAGMGVCLAYLALDRFRYRDEIEKNANAKLEQFTVMSEDEGLEAVKDLRWLCRNKNTPESIFSRILNWSLNHNANHTPRGFIWGIYNWTFRKKFDEFIMCILAVLCVIILSVGVTIKINFLNSLSFLNSEIYTKIGFIICFASITLPAIAVLLGRKCVKSGLALANESEEQINRIMLKAAKNATTPQIIPPQDLIQ